MKQPVLFVLVFFSWIVCHAAPVFVEGQDYKVLTNHSMLSEEQQQGTVIVKEFFSYGCPWCYKLESKITSWRKELPKSVTLSKVPVIFEADWELYAKAYYAAEILGLERRISYNLFHEIQVKKNKVDTEKAMITFFMRNGISEKVATSAFTSSPTIDAKVREGIAQMQMLQVNAVPSFVINNHYKVDIAMADGDSDKLFRVIGFLIAKELATMLHKR